MATFGNDTKGNHGLQRAGAHPYTQGQQNADTDGFLQGDFCRIGYMGDCLATAEIGSPDAANYCHQFSDVKQYILKRNTVDILRNSVTGPEKEGKRSPYKPRISTSLSGECTGPARPSSPRRRRSMGELVKGDVVVVPGAGD